jgi:hypothetical protein
MFKNKIHPFFPTLEVQKVQVKKPFPSLELSEALINYDPNNQDQAKSIREHIKVRESRGSYFRDR